MTVDEFLLWSEGQPGRWELYRGVAYAMAPVGGPSAGMEFAFPERIGF